MGHADLPEEFADLLRPLRRRATLGPVAALTATGASSRCETTRHHFRPAAGRQGHRTSGRPDHRPLSRGDDHPHRPGHHDEQIAWLDRAFIQAGATEVPRFLRLVVRLGAPATGPTDLPMPEPFDADAPFKRFVSQLLALRLRRIVEADLAIRGGDLTAIGRLADEAARLRDELRGLSPVLDAEWVEDVYDELGWISLDSAPSGHGRPRPAGLAAPERALSDRAGAAGRGGAGAEAGRVPGRLDRCDPDGTEWPRSDRLRQAADALTADSPTRSGTTPGGRSGRLQLGARRRRPGGARGPSPDPAPARPGGSARPGAR